MMKFKKGILFYYLGVLVFFLVILLAVRYIVNNTRVFVGYEEGINPVEIQWNCDRRDSILRVVDPLYLHNQYYLINYENEAFIKSDSVLYNDLFNDTIPNKGSLMNVTPPYILWKSQKNDTIKLFKHNKTLKFTRRN